MKFQLLYLKLLAQAKIIKKCVTMSMGAKLKIKTFILKKIIISLPFVVCKESVFELLGNSLVILVEKCEGRVRVKVHELYVLDPNLPAIEHLMQHNFQ